MVNTRTARFIRAGAMALVFAVDAGAQSGRPVWPLSVDPVSATTGSADEASLLLLQLVGRAPLTQRTIRDFSMGMLDALASIERPRAIRPLSRGVALQWMRPVATAWFNSSSPSETDGVVWTGRGLTTAITGGGVARFGALAIALRPVAFWSQNSAFTPPLGGAPSQSPPPYPFNIDLPSRFGQRTYSRLDPGESFVQLDTRYLIAGISTATQVWGPMHVFPLLLGPNAGGFPHAQLGSGLPWNIGIGKVGARVAVGRLDPSAFAPPHVGDRRRLASEFVGSFTPKGLDGLEIGAGRFFHRRWPTDGVGLDAFTIPFEGLLKKHLPNKDDPNQPGDNQLASIFFTLMLPSDGVEVYGEFLRDDHNFDTYDLIGEPDHESAYAIGLRRAWGSRSNNDALSVLTLEAVNGRITALGRLRGESPVYIHNELVEGHTERGQLLGAPAAFGGSGYAILWRRVKAHDGWGVSLQSESIAHDKEGGNFQGSHVGFHSIEGSRLLMTDRGEWTVRGKVRFGWGPQSGGNNIEMSVGFRPGRSR